MPTKEYLFEMNCTTGILITPILSAKKRSFSPDSKVQSDLSLCVTHH
jgi:hypothetical protein